VGSFLLPSLKNKVGDTGLVPEIEIFGWNNVRDFSTADFYARAVVFLALGFHNGTFNVGSGKGKSVLSFAKSQLNFKLKSRRSSRERPSNKMVANVKKIRNAGFRIE
jgi:hypothetical protein